MKKQATNKLAYSHTFNILQSAYRPITKEKLMIFSRKNYSRYIEDKASRANAPLIALCHQSNVFA